MKQKLHDRPKRLVDAFIKTDNPVRLNAMLEKQADSLPTGTETRTIALSSVFQNELKYFPGFQKLRRQCRDENSHLEWNGGWVRTGGKFGTISLIIKIDPGRPFTGFREAKTHGLPAYHKS
jgi:hypothetical protein